MNGLSIETLENINKHVTNVEQIIEFIVEANGMIIGNI